MIINSTSIFNFILLLIFTMATKEKLSSKAFVLPQNQMETQLYKTDTIGLQTDSIIDLSGQYELIKGRTVMIDSEDFIIYKGALVIEKLSDTDFGFYYANKVKELTPTGHFGIMRNFKNEYRRLRVCSESMIKGYSNENFVKGIYLNHEIMIKQEGDLLAFIHYGINFRSYGLYRKKKPEDNFYISVIKTLKENKVFYKKSLLEYEEALNYDKSKLEIEHVYKDRVWLTKHKHDVVDGIISYTHSYSNPHQKDQFTKQDSLFYADLLNYK